MTSRLSFAFLCALSLAACRGGGTSAPSRGDDPGVRHRPDEPPPHVFNPRPHRPRQRIAVPPPPDPRTLPSLVDRSAQCFGHERPESGAYQPRPQPRPKPTRKRRKKVASNKGGSGYVPYGSAGDGSVAGGSPGGAVGGLAEKNGGATTRSPAPRPKQEPARGSGRGAGKKKDASRRPPADNSPAPAAPTATPAPEAEPASAADSVALDDRSSARESKKSSRRRRRDGERNNEAAGDAYYQEEDELLEEREQQMVTPEEPEDQYHDWGASIYLSNDDTMSLSSAQRVMFAIDEFLPLPLEHIRPHELLNYFSFDTARVGETDDFSVLAGVDADPDQPGIYSLALAVRGRPLGKAGRRNVDLAFAVDRSGSMSAEGRMEYLKRGLMRSLSELKDGDMVHLVLFDHRICTPIENFVVGRDPMSILQRAISRIQPQGSTDVHGGLRTAYDLVDRSYRPEYGNRVVLITDALTNTGVTDAEMISLIGRYYDNRRIRLSGVGVGREFNDELLDRLTEKGKGAYVFLGSAAEVDAVFGSRFTSLIETTANDVHFQLHLPPSLRMNVFYGEESSVVKEDVQAIHYFANTSQLFLSDVMARGGRLRPQDQVMLTIDYEHPETGEDMVEEYAFTLADAQESSRNARKGRVIMRFIDGLAWMASRQPPAGWGSRAGAWQDEGAWRECEVGREDLIRLGSGLEDDPEISRVRGLWDRYCSRYERPRNPVRRTDDAAPDAWPGARGGRG